MYQGNIHKILFLDIETASQQPHYDELDPMDQALWNLKARSLIRNPETDTPSSIYERAGIYAEFGKVICISCGFITSNHKLRIKSFYGDDEKMLLQEFAQLLANQYHSAEHRLCAHNGKEFDFPYLCRRMVIHRLPIPSILDIAGKKPWETTLLDTMELWRFGDFKSFTSLNLLSRVLGLPSPKDDIDGSQVGKVYWQERNLPRIVTYCQKDVLTLTNIFLRLQEKEPIPDSDIEMV